jgi:hypothetical protein
LGIGIGAVHMQVKKPIGRSVGSFVPQLTRTAVEKYGFPQAAILTDWAAIVGPDLASYTQPERLRWPRGAGNATEDNPWNGADGATLILRVAGPRALEIQHRTEQLIERVNAYFGFRAVIDVRLMQAPLAKAKAAAAPRTQAPVTPIPAAEVADDRLRDVLERLGGNVRRQAAKVPAAR